MIPGLHYVTAIASDPQRNYDFYARFPGLRLVKKTIAFDDLLSAAILLRPMVPFIPQSLPDLSLTRVLLAGGRRDPIATPDHVERLERLLAKAGANVSIHWPSGGHPLEEGDVAAAKSWLARSVNGR
jgi:predicted esterase